MTQNSTRRIHVGVTWYHQEQYDVVRAYCEDGDSMDKTFEEWKAGAENAVRELRSDGNEVVRIDFDLEEFKLWCSVKGKKPNASSRSEYTVEKLRDSDKGRRPG